VTAHSTSAKPGIRWRTVLRREAVPSRSAGWDSRPERITSGRRPCSPLRVPRRWSGVAPLLVP
jgi:hypothetical protein